LAITVALAILRILWSIAGPSDLVFKSSRFSTLEKDTKVANDHTGIVFISDYEPYIIQLAITVALAILRILWSIAGPSDLLSFIAFAIPVVKLVTWYVKPTTLKNDQSEQNGCWKLEVIILFGTILAQSSMLGASSSGGFVISLLLRIVWGMIGPSKAWKQALKYIIVTVIKLIIGPITVLLSMCGVSVKVQGVADPASDMATVVTYFLVVLSLVREGLNRTTSAIPIESYIALCAGLLMSSTSIYMRSDDGAVGAVSNKLQIVVLALFCVALLCNVEVPSLQLTQCHLIGASIANVITCLFLTHVNHFLKSAPRYDMVAASFISGALNLLVFVSMAVIHLYIESMDGVIIQMVVSSIVYCFNIAVLKLIQHLSPSQSQENPGLDIIASYYGFFMVNSAITSLIEGTQYIMNASNDSSINELFGVIKSPSSLIFPLIIVTSCVAALGSFHIGSCIFLSVEAALGSIPQNALHVKGKWLLVSFTCCILAVFSSLIGFVGLMCNSIMWFSVAQKMVEI